MDCSTSLSFTISSSLLKFISIELMIPSNRLILCCPLLSPSVLPRIRVFSNEVTLHIRWPNIRASASASVLPMNTQGWSPLGWTGWISLLCKGLSWVFSSTTIRKNQFLSNQPSLWSNSHIYPYMTAGKTIALTTWTFVCKAVSLILLCYLGLLWFSFQAANVF